MLIQLHSKATIGILGTIPSNPQAPIYNHHGRFNQVYHHCPHFNGWEYFSGFSVYSGLQTSVVTHVFGLLSGIMAGPMILRNEIEMVLHKALKKMKIVHK